ncbi:unnamed protein product [Chilo suppressalis]|uniref:Uncharacterized protein n=1 Tax=Chilo suppressalis TaxID=168631 RepID=A0ABN8AVA1_CHISP|nr:unnamed protein product [Chilo suppressalis]
MSEKEASKDEWTVVKRKHSSMPASSSLLGVLRGTAAPGTTSLTAAERKKYIHLYYVKEGTTVEQMSEEAWDKIFDVNVKSSWLLTKEAYPELIKRGGGNIVFVSSIAAYNPIFPLGPYGVSKTALLGLTKALAAELVHDNIRVNGVAPGIIATKFASFLTSSESVQERSLESIPMKRFGKPEEIASAVAFLVSEDASYMTGETVVVAGGSQAHLADQRKIEEANKKLDEWVKTGILGLLDAEADNPESPLIQLICRVAGKHIDKINQIRKEGERSIPLKARDMAKGRDAANARVAAKARDAEKPKEPARTYNQMVADAEKPRAEAVGRRQVGSENATPGPSVQPEGVQQGKWSIVGKNGREKSKLALKRERRKARKQAAKEAASNAQPLPAKQKRSTAGTGKRQGPAPPKSKGYATTTL